MRGHAKAPVAVLAAITLFLVLASAAQASKGVAGYLGTGTGSGSKGSQFNQPRDIAVNRTGAGPANPGDLYVVEDDNARIQRFDSNGNFVSAWGANVLTAPVNEAQTVTVDATGGTFTLTFRGATTAPIPEGSFGPAVGEALQSLPTVRSSNVEGEGAAGGPWTLRFQGGLSATEIPQMTASPAGLTGGASTAVVATTTDGSGAYEICAVAANCRAGAATGGANEVGNAKNGSLDNPQSVAVDNDTGNVYVSDRDGRRINEYDGAGNFIRSFGFAVDDTTAGEGYEVCPAADRCTFGAPGSGAGQIGGSLEAGILGIAVSPANGEAAVGSVYLADSQNRRVNTYALDGTSPASFGSAAQFGEIQPRKIAVDSRSIVYASDLGNEIERYDSQNANGGGTVFLAPIAAALLPGTSETATSGLAVDPDSDGGGSDEDVLYVLRDPSTGNTAVQQFGPVNDPGLTVAPTADDDKHGAAAGFGTVQGLGLDELNDRLYVSGTEDVSGTGAGHRVYMLGSSSPPSASVDSIADTTSTGAKISGTINPSTPTAFPNPPTTAYHLEYKLSPAATWIQYAPDANVGAGTSGVPVAAFLSNLIPNRSYDVRFVATKQFGGGVTVSAPQTFLTLPAPPTIDAFFSSNVTATSADLNALINPLGKNTTYRFEYGTTVSYGSTTPDAELPASPNPQAVTAHIAGLNGGTYHFRVVAESEAGATTTGNQTFSFYPPNCPNAHLREQTGASFLPDCRAYELVSPANAGGVRLKAHGPFSPVATRPSRLSFGGELGAIPDAGPAQAETEDLYVATRRQEGWTSRYVGIPSNEKPQTGGPPFEGEGRPADVFANSSLDRIMSWDPGVGTGGGRFGSFAPYLWDDVGTSLGRLPSNLAEIPGGEAEWMQGGFYGDVRPSADFSHYFFTSANVAFTPDGLTSGSGSAYDNDIEAGTVEKISLLPGGGDIPEEPGDATNDDFLRLPAASSDGSHVLIEVPRSGVCGIADCLPPPLICNKEFVGTPRPGGCPGPLPSHLYMRVGGGPAAGGVTYDISGTHAVTFRGMTPDGSKLYFTSSEQVTGDDSDTSVDLFMWSEKPVPAVTRISAGSLPTGNVDNCGATWTTGCGVEVVQGICKCNPGGAESIPARSDNSVAPESGDIYFMSPEQLASGEGTPAQKNLYVYREGQPQYVATLFGTATINRIQVSPDGSRVAFVTAARLTSYDNTSPSGVCTPTNPVSGTPATGPQCREMYTYDPSTGVIKCASCMPDGSPPESDVEASLNGLFMTDDGRAFFSTEDPLVAQDTDGQIDIYEFVENRPQLISSGTAASDRNRFNRAGLVGVSADGTDAYFLTLDTFVGQDQNGDFFKFYDARTNGGFAFTPPAASCAAADECHGASSSPPAAIATGTTESLGNGGNHRSAKNKKKRHKKKHRGKHKKHSRTHKAGSAR